MSETTGQRPTRAVAATVMSKAETAEGFKLELQVPEFKSDYPTIVTRVPKELAAQLQAGTAYNLVLEQQNVSKRRDGTPYDGSKPWMYYWGLQGIAGASDPLPSPGEPQAKDEPETRDATRVSIERQKALDIAERLYSRYASESDLSMAEHSTRLLLMASKLALWLATGKSPVSSAVPNATAPGRNAAPRPPVAAQGASTESGEEEATF